MSMTSIDRNVYPAMAEALQSVEFREEPTEHFSEQNFIQAREKGRDMIDHFTKFIGDEEDTFERIFHVVSPVHEAMHQGFWDELRTKYPDMVTLDFPDYPFEQQHVFYDLGVALIAKRRFHEETGDVFDVSYNAVRLGSERSLGTVAVAHLD